MLCPSCTAVVAKGSGFCSYCGYQMPVVVGVSYPYGIRFPYLRGDSTLTSLAMAAPSYSRAIIGDMPFHVCLFDRPTLPLLADLHRIARVTQSHGTLLHTVDGGLSWFGGPSFWACIARRLHGDGIFEGEVEHWGSRCHSYFGCVAAQRRQHAMYHREGWEVFYPGRHGLFDADPVSSLFQPGCFVIDKTKVAAEVSVLITRAGCHRCPLYSPSYFQQQVRALPDMLEFGTATDRGFFDCALHGRAAWWRCY